MENLRNIPSPLLSKAKEMGVVPWIHNSDFLFEFVTGLWKGDAERAIHNYYELGKYSSLLAKTWVDDYIKLQQTIRERVPNAQAVQYPRAILDFASGYGCVSRHLSLQFPEATVQTCDIHREAVSFSRDILNLESYLSTISPQELELPKQDLIICLSFFSHMPKTTFSRWLEKIVSLLSSEGLLIFTANGHVTHTSVVKDVIVDREGFGFKPSSEQKDLSGEEYGLTISYPPFVLNLMEQCPDVRLVRFQEGLWWATQDTYMYVKN
jgi:hypothetical protein